MEISELDGTIGGRESATHTFDHTTQLGHAVARYIQSTWVVAPVFVDFEVFMEYVLHAPKD